MSTQPPKIRMDTRALQKMAANRVLPSGHEVWARKASREDPPTQWEMAISRQMAQYHQVEKHGREVDCVHAINYNRTEKRSRVAHFDDQVYHEMRNKKSQGPTCLQEMPLCSFKNREYLRRIKVSQVEAK